MSYNGAGAFVINTAGQPVVTGTVISSTAFNALTADLATGLSTAITKDGQTATTARIPFAAGISSTLVTDSTSTSTGSIITAGGAGIAKALYVGTTSNLAGAATLGSTLTYGGVTLTNAVTGTGKMVLDTSPTLVTPALGTPASGVLTNCTGVQYNGFKNRLINSAMVIDQRNAGASVSVGTATGTYTLDRWRVYHDTAITSNITAQQSTTVPTTGYINSQILTNGTAASAAAGDVNIIQQRVEGLNVADLNFGSATAATVTLSFWVRSSLTGTFAVTLSNSAQNRSYVSTYAISAANTWEQKTVTVAGDQSGTWLTTSGIGLIASWDLGSGTSLNTTAGAWQSGQYFRTSACTSFIGTTGATFYVTGVQLEKGSTATSFDYRPYGTELALCQRYYFKVVGSTFPNASFGSGKFTSTTSVSIYAAHPVAMRDLPTWSYGGTVVAEGTSSFSISAIAAQYPSYYATRLALTVSGATAGQGAIAQISTTSSDFVQASAEL